MNHPTMRGCLKSQWFGLMNPLTLDFNGHRIHVVANKGGVTWQLDNFSVSIPSCDAYSTVEIDGNKCAECVRSFRQYRTENWVGPLTLVGCQRANRYEYRDSDARLVLVYRPRCFHIGNADFVCRPLPSKLQAIATGICLASLFTNAGE